MARDLTVTELLAALVATKNLDLPDTIAIAEFADHVNAQFKEPPSTLESALDAALDFFNDPPDVEAAKTAERIQAARDASTCPDCGGPLDDMDEDDYDLAFSLYYTVRNMIDKRFFEYVHVPGEGPDQEEC